MRRSVGVAFIVATVALSASCTSDDDDGADDGDGAEQVVVAALDAMQDNDAGAAWSSLHPDERNRTDEASFTQCVASQQLARGQEKSKHRVTEVRAEDDPEVAGRTIAGRAMRVTIEFWNSEAETRGGGPVLDFYAIEADGLWRWADPHLDVAKCARLPIE